MSNSIQSKEFKFFWSVCASLNINLYSSLPIQWCSHGVHWRYVISCCLPTIHKRKTIVLYDFLQLSKRHYLWYTVRWRYNQKQVFEYNKTLVHFLFSVSIWFTSIWYCPKSTWTLLKFFIVWHFWMLRHLVILKKKTIWWNRCYLLFLTILLGIANKELGCSVKSPAITSTTFWTFSICKMQYVFQAIKTDYEIQT